VNDLNSVLIEGTVISEPIRLAPSRDDSVSVVRLRTQRKTRDADDYAIVAIHVHHATGIMDGMSLRIVGRLCQQYDGEIYIDAEYVERRTVQRQSSVPR